MKRGVSWRRLRIIVQQHIAGNINRISGGGGEKYRQASGSINGGNMAAMAYRVK